MAHPVVSTSDPSSGLSFPPIAMVVSRYNASITDRLAEGAWCEYTTRGGRSDDLTIIDAPGSFELPALCFAAARTGRFEGVLALGCLIKGETIHDVVIANAVANGLVSVTIKTGVPAAFGVLTVNNAKQAKARAGGNKGNKGAEAMGALLDTILAMKTCSPNPTCSPTVREGRIARARPDKARMAAKPATRRKP